MGPNELGSIALSLQIPPLPPPFIGMYLCSFTINSPLIHCNSSSEVDHMTQMQGIVTILGSDNHEKTTRAGSLRRTLSADMSSKRWLADNGLSVSPTMKKVASSERIAIDSCSSDDEEEGELNGKGGGNPRRIDIWTAIMSQKAQDHSLMLPPPYVHPLVKKSASSLSEKSLKVCTESLGSETGSDVFSSYPSSDTADENKVPQDQEEEVEETKETDGEEQKVVKHVTCLTTKKAHQARSLPPPLSSLAAARSDGPSLQMHSHRVDGRLVLEAVSVPQQNYFETQRQDGRFLLTLFNNPKEQASEQIVEDKFSISDKERSQQENNEYEDEIECNFSDKEARISKVRPLNLASGVIKFHKSMVSIKRINERDNENPSWSRKLDVKTAKLKVVEEEEASSTPPRASPKTQSVPPPPRTTGRPPLPPSPAATSFNTYQYFWRAKPTVASVIDPLITQHRPPTKTKDLVLLRGNKADCLLPSLKGCKEPRRSLLMWEPFCIATS